MTEPDWTDVSAVRAWLDDRYPKSKNETHSPFFQYLRDEKAKGNKINGRETHLSRQRGGELRKWVWEEAEHSVFYHPERSMKVTYYPEYVDELSPLSSPEPYEEPPKRTTPDPIRPLLEEFRRQNQLRKQQEALLHQEKTTRRSARAKVKVLPLPTSNPESLERPRLRQKPPVPSKVVTSKSCQQNSKGKRRSVNEISKTRSIGLGSSTLQKERISTLRPRRDLKHPKTGKSICLHPNS